MRRIVSLLVALDDDRSEAIRVAHRLAPRVPDGPRGERMVIIDRRERGGGGDRGAEAWVLRRVLGWSERDAAKALDCSRTVLRRHLEPRAEREDPEEIRLTRARMNEAIRNLTEADVVDRVGVRWKLLRWAVAAATLLAGLAWWAGRQG